MTEQYNNFERELGWDDTITHDSEFLILEPGEYWFTVKGFERARHEPSPQNTNPNKLPACNKAVIELLIVDFEGKEKTIKHNLFLHSRTEGMISAFFGAIGQKKHGEPLRMNWGAIIGQVGVCSIKKSKTSNGNDFNEVGYMVYADKVDPTKQLNQRPGKTQAQPPYQAPVQQPYQPPVQAPYQQPVQPPVQQGGFTPGQF